MKMILGVSDIGQNAVLAEARRLRAPVMVSANRLAVRRKDGHGLPRFHGFNTRPLSHLAGFDAHLDSAGFVAMVTYRGFDWTVQQYVALGASHPWRWFASMDACVEPEMAPNRSEVLNRIAWTVQLNRACRREAEHQGCADRLLPVIQGARGDDYVRCLDLLPEAADAPVIGVGSMCRRRTGGVDGVLSAVDAMDRALGSSATRLHLFGVKSDAAEALRSHPRVASADSQAYGTRLQISTHEARRRARQQDDLLGAVTVSKPNTAVAAAMRGWYGRQTARLSRRGSAPAATAMLPVPEAEAGSAWERKLERAWEQLRALVADGEMDWSDLNARMAWQWAADLDDEPGE